MLLRQDGGSGRGKEPGGERRPTRRGKLHHYHPYLWQAVPVHLPRARVICGRFDRRL